MKTVDQNAIIILSIILFGINTCTAQVNYTSHHPCSFDIKLPSSFIFENMYGEDDNLDVCDYHVKWRNDEVLIEVHSMNKFRFDYSTIIESYNHAIKNTEYTISYKTQKNNWFVISGINVKNKKIIYWKQVLGENFVSNLYVEYPSDKKELIEPYIGEISKSFSSD